MKVVARKEETRRVATWVTIPNLDSGLWFTGFNKVLYIAVKPSTSFKQKIHIQTACTVPATNLISTTWSCLTLKQNIPLHLWKNTTTYCGGIRETYLLIFFRFLYFIKLHSTCDSYRTLRHMYIVGDREQGPYKIILSTTCSRDAYWKGHAEVQQIKMLATLASYREC